MEQIAPPSGYILNDHKFKITVSIDEDRKILTQDGIQVKYLHVKNEKLTEDHKVIHSKTWYDLLEQPIKWPHGYHLEFVVLQNGVPYKLTDGALNGATWGEITSEGLLRIPYSNNLTEQNGLYNFQLSLPKGNPINGEEYIYSFIEVIVEPENNTNPYFWFPKYARVTESNNTIHFDNLDPSTEVTLVFDID